MSTIGAGIVEFVSSQFDLLVKEIREDFLSQAAQNNPEPYSLNRAISLALSTKTTVQRFMYLHHLVSIGAEAYQFVDPEPDSHGKVSLEAHLHELLHGTIRELLRLELELEAEDSRRYDKARRLIEGAE